MAGQKQDLLSRQACQGGSLPFKDNVQLVASLRLR